MEVLIEQGEHQQQDFKYEVSDSKKIARTLSAFANTDGGRLLIGVKDNGHISGIRGDEEYYMVEAASKMYTRPEVPFKATHWDVEGKTVLEIDIEPCPNRPYLAPDKNDAYRAFIRVADENILADGVIVRAWKKRRKPQGTLLRLNPPVRLLLSYLEEYETISLKRFCKMANITYKAAKDILSDLMAIGTIDYVLKDKHILYRLGGGETM